VTLEFSLVLLINPHPHQMGHDLAQSAIMVAFYPHHFNAALWIRELPNVTEKLPVRLGEASEVEIGKDVAQQDQATEAILPQHPRGLLGAADLRSQVQVREDERVIGGGTHHNGL